MNDCIVHPRELQVGDWVKYKTKPFHFGEIKFVEPGSSTVYTVKWKTTGITGTYYADSLVLTSLKEIESAS